jgi:hypothetical protein
MDGPTTDGSTTDGSTTEEPTTEEATTEEPSGDNDKDPSFWGRIKAFFQKIVDFFRRIFGLD